MAQKKLFDTRLDVPMTSEQKGHLAELAQRNDEHVTALARRIFAEYIRQHMVTRHVERQLLGRCTVCGNCEHDHRGFEHPFTQ